jgi:hypothetical protein
MQTLTYNSYINLHSTLHELAPSIEEYIVVVRRHFVECPSNPFVYSPFVKETEVLVQDNTEFSKGLKLCGIILLIRFGFEPHPSILSKDLLTSVHSVRLLMEPLSYFMAYHPDPDREEIRAFCKRLKPALRNLVIQLGCKHAEEPRIPATAKTALVVASTVCGSASMQRCTEFLLVALKENGYAVEFIIPDPSTSIPEFISATADKRYSILVIVDVMSSPFTLILPYMRVADIQIACHGNPWTSGSDQMDYFLTSDWDNQKYYTEKLVPLGPLGVTVGVSEAQPDLPAPKETHGVLLPWPPFKCTHHMLRVLQRIDEVMGGVEWICCQIVDRADHQKKVGKYLKNLTWVEQDIDKYYKALSTVDCVIAPHPFGIFNVVADCFKQQVPCFTLCDRDYYPTRIASEVNKLVGLEKFNAKTEEELVDKVVQYLRGPRERTVVDWSVLEKHNMALAEATKGFISRLT